jgi:chorismate mutase
MIDTVDLNILKNINKRSLIVKRIWDIKKQRGISIYDEDREKIILNRINKYSTALKLDREKINKIYTNIIGDHFHSA